MNISSAKILFHARIQKIGNVELYWKIVDLQGEVVSLSTEKLRYEQKDAKLKKRREMF